MPRFDVDSDGGVPLTSQELVVHQLYDAIYCIHVHSNRKELVLYQLTKETVIRRIRLDLLTAGTSYIHIVDNLLLVHNKTSRVTMMFDIKSKKDMGSFPVASPLPLSPVPYEPPPDATFLAEPLLPQSIDSRTSVLPHTTSMNPNLYEESWTFYLPCYIVDRNAGFCWNVGLNLDGIVQSLTNDRSRMTEFLLRRTIPRTKKVLLRELLAMVVEHESLAVCAQVFDSLNGVLSALLREGILDASSSSPNIHTHYTIASVTKAGSLSGAQGQKGDAETLEPEWTAEQVETLEATDPDDISASTTAIVAPSSMSNSYTQPQAHQPSTALRIGDSVVSVTQADMYTHVFVPIEGRDPPLLDTKYVVGVITEYIRSLNFHHVAVTPFLYELLINFLVSNSRWYQLHQFLQYHVVSDSTHVACQLLSLESKYPPAYQLALDMMKRLSTHEQIVEVLISKNFLLQALRFMKSHRVKIPPKRLLEAAVQQRDNAILFHVYKFFESRKELTEDCEKYVHLARKIFGDQKVYR